MDCGRGDRVRQTQRSLLTLLTPLSSRLIEGIEIYGMGHWSEIKNDANFRERVSINFSYLSNINSNA